MKLMFCTQCCDIIQLAMDRRRCECGASDGAYDSDGWHAWMRGPVIPLGIDNGSFQKAIMHQPDTGPGKRIDAFVIAKDCDTVRVLDALPIATKV